MKDKINLARALASFEAKWDPRIVATLNEYDVRVVHIEGEFIWHSHADTDELFLVLAGACQIELRDRTIDLEVGDLYVVRRGVEHRPVSVGGADLMLVEPQGTTNTGDTHDDVPDHIATTSGTVI